MKFWDQNAKYVELALPVLARSRVAQEVLLGGGMLSAVRAYSRGMAGKLWVGRYYDGADQGDRRKFRHRRDVKRWMLAKAAGIDLPVKPPPDVETKALRMAQSIKQEYRRFKKYNRRFRRAYVFGRAYTKL